jgi:anti-sigma factor RsiW
VARIRPFTRTDDHDWTQRHVSHYVESDLAARARRRLERHAAECPECGRAVRAMKTLLRLIAHVDAPGETPGPDTLFSRVRAEAIDAPTRNRGDRG